MNFTDDDIRLSVGEKLDMGLNGQGIEEKGNRRDRDRTDLVSHGKEPYIVVKLTPSELCSISALVLLTWRASQ